MSKLSPRAPGEKLQQDKLNPLFFSRFLDRIGISVFLARNLLQLALGRKHPADPGIDGSCHIQGLCKSLEGRFGDVVTV